MITGTVSADGREAQVALELHGSKAEESTNVEAVIDTGFTDWLTLPRAVVEEMNLALRGSASVMLADGRVEELQIYRVGLIWHGRRRSVRAYAAPGEALLGMSLLRGSRLHMDVEPGGAVTIEEKT